MSKQIKYRDSVIYNNELYTVFTATKSDSINIKNAKNGTTKKVKKSEVKLLNHNRYDIIQYDNTFYKINDIVVQKVNGNNIIYELEEFKNRSNKTSINSNDPDIINIPSQYQDKLSQFLSFIDKYNSTLRFLINRKINTKTDTQKNYLYRLIDNNDVIEMMNKLLFQCKLNINQLYKINHTIKKCQDPTLQIHKIYETPFDFIRQDFQLLSFEKAEKIAQDFNLHIDFIVKCEKWIYSIFTKENTFYLAKWKFNKDFVKFCERYNEIASKIDIEKFVLNIKIDGKEYKTTQFLLDTEIELTDLMMDLFYDNEYDIPNEEIENLIQTYETTYSTTKFKKFEEDQKKGIIKCVKNKFSIITGFPGTGKTEIVRCILYILGKLSKKYFPDLSSEKVSLMSPTGLAYLNLHRSLEKNYYNEKISGTCHRTLYHTFSKIMNEKKKEDKNDLFNEFKYESNNDLDENADGEDEIDVKLIILDESSMMDILLFYETVKACKYFDARLIIIGDINQLPSIGPGIVLKNLIDSNCFEVTKLTKIKRQDAGSLVSTIKKMTNEIINYTKFKDDTISVVTSNEFITSSGEIHRDAIINLIKTNNFNKNTTKFITYFNNIKFKFNTNNINNILQDTFNPSNGIDNIQSTNKYDNDYIFRINDKIIRTENDYSSEKMRANGEEAEILDFDGKLVIIKYINDPNAIRESITIDELYDNFKLNYCITIHKSQGSQYDNVVLFIEPNQNIIDKTSLYTAISRARNKCIVVSKKEDFVKCQINNNSFDNKVSLFMRRSKKYEL
jgi:exodeoxyribonuclease V alpha subunit